MYLVAVMDWWSRRVLSWRVSNTLDRAFCVEALEEALARYGAPEIFNTDQGAQFTSEACRSAYLPELRSAMPAISGVSKLDRNVRLKVLPPIPTSSRMLPSS